MTTCKLIATLLLLCIYLNPAKAQVKYQDSKEVLSKGIALYDSGEYKKALEVYRTINENDTNYATCLYEQVLTLQADSNYTEAKALALQGLKLRNSDKREFYLILAALQDYLKHSDSAIIIYDSLKKRYPNDNIPYYEEGIVFYKQENYDKAIDYFQKSLILNPNHFKSHYMLGLMYALQGRLTEAFIAYNVSLLMTQSTEMARKSISPISGITEATDEVVKLHDKKADKYSHPLFDEIDQLLLSKLALSSKYDLKMSLNDNIFKQLQALTEKLKFDPEDNNFVMQYYVPMLTEIYQKDMFEPMVLLMYSGFGFEQIDNISNKKKKEIDEARKIIFPYLANIQSTRVLNYKERQKTPEMYHYYPNDNLIIIGKAVKMGNEENIVGDAVFYRGDHTLRSKGKFNDKGEKEGWWYSYFTNGMLSSKVYYIANDERDTSNYYYINGNLKRKVIMDAQGKAIKEFVYDFGGWLSTVRVKIDDKMYSETTYFANGKLEAEFIYNGSDLKDGTYSVYYDNGKLKRQFTVLNGKTSGASKSYFEDGSPNIYSNYINGLFEGSYTAYYKGGVMKEKSTYTKGKQTGEYEEYYESGKLSEKGLYGAKTKEDLTKYAENGNIYGIMKLKDNVPTHLKFMDDANNVVYEKEDASGLYNYPLFYSNGVKAVDMKINENGRREGLLSFYYSTSAKSEDCNYKDGDLVGKSTSYFKDGKLKSEANYVKDQLDGYYRLLFYNGQTNLEGWYKEGKKQGEWISYSVNGKIESDKYYQDDEFNGYLKQYNINGELRDKYIYQFGMPVGIVCYDTSGLIVTDSIYFGNKNGKIGFTHDPLKKTKDGEFTIHGGSFDGEVKFWYANGQLKKHEFFKMGKRDSTSIFYYPDGKVKTKGTYLNGEKVGKWLNYNELGELVKEDNFNNYGEVDGDMFGYANKILHVKYHFNKGNKDGEQTYYGENGRIAFKLIYEKGDLVAYTYEGKDGKMLPPIKLKNGSGKMICYYSNGTKSGEAEFDQNAIKNGLRVYFTNGKLAEERNYRNFDLYGDFKRYNPDGTLVYEAVYKDDEILGKEKTYDNAGKLVIDADYYYGEYQGITRVTNTATSKTVNYHYHYGTLTKSN